MPPRVRDCAIICQLEVAKNGEAAVVGIQPSGLLDAVVPAWVGKRGWWIDVARLAEHGDTEHVVRVVLVRIPAVVADVVAVAGGAQVPGTAESGV